MRGVRLDRSAVNNVTASTPTWGSPTTLNGLIFGPNSSRDSKNGSLPRRRHVQHAESSNTVDDCSEPRLARSVGTEEWEKHQNDSPRFASQTFSGRRVRSSNLIVQMLDRQNSERSDLDSRRCESERDTLVRTVNGICPPGDDNAQSQQGEHSEATAGGASTKTPSMYGTIPLLANSPKRRSRTSYYARTVVKSVEAPRSAHAVSSAAVGPGKEEGPLRTPRTTTTHAESESSSPRPPLHHSQPGTYDAAAATPSDSQSCLNASPPFVRTSRAQSTAPPVLANGSGAHRINATLATKRTQSNDSRCQSLTAAVPEEARDATPARVSPQGSSQQTTYATSPIHDALPTAKPDAASPLAPQSPRGSVSRTNILPIAKSEGTNSSNSNTNSKSNSSREDTTTTTAAAAASATAAAADAEVRGSATEAMYSKTAPIIVTGTHPSVQTAAPTTAASVMTRAAAEAAAKSEGGELAEAGAEAAADGPAYTLSRPMLNKLVSRWRNGYEENKNAYSAGGYLNVIPGKLLHSRYVMIQKLGYGEFSTVWLAYDTKYATQGRRGAEQAFVAVKIAKCEPSVRESTQYEIFLLRYFNSSLAQDAPSTVLIDVFEVMGEFGNHQCMVMPVHGSNLLSVIDHMKSHRQERRTPEEILLVKELLCSTLHGLRTLKDINVIHTDIKPENILCYCPDAKLLSTMETFCQRNQNRSNVMPAEYVRKYVAHANPHHLVCLADFGLSAVLETSSSPTYFSKDSSTRSLLSRLLSRKKEFPVSRPGVVDNTRGTLIQTREYRAPEVLLGMHFTCETDVWSVGCLVFELITGEFLMDPKRRTKNERQMDVEHFAMMIQLLGPPPREITALRTNHNGFYEKQRLGLRCVPSNPPPPVYIHRFIDSRGRFMYADRCCCTPRHLDAELEPYFPTKQEAKEAADFILACLGSYDPEKRPSAEQLLQHPWLKGIGESQQH